MSLIPAHFYQIPLYYPKRTTRDSQFGGKLEVAELRKLMEGLPGTPCCVQVTHALNLAGETIPSTYPGQVRTPLPTATVGGVKYTYLPAVHELRTYLTNRYGKGERVNMTADGKMRNSAQVMAFLQGRYGLLVMYNRSENDHAEFWNGTSMLQTGMSAAVLDCPEVLFWDLIGPPSTTPAKWLTDYMGRQS